MADVKLYSGHSAPEVIELMDALAKQHDIHSADETLAIVRKGAELLKDQAFRLDQAIKDRDEARTTGSVARGNNLELLRKLDALELRLDVVLDMLKRAHDYDNATYFADKIREKLGV